MVAGRKRALRFGKHLQYSEAPKPPFHAYGQIANRPSKIHRRAQQHGARRAQIKHGAARRAQRVGRVDGRARGAAQVGLQLAAHALFQPVIALAATGK